MSWAELHRASERQAGEALMALREGRTEDAANLYREAAILECDALRQLPEDKIRTFGVTLVSAVSLLRKGNELEAAQQLCQRYLRDKRLPVFASAELSAMLAETKTETEGPTHEVVVPFPNANPTRMANEIVSVARRALMANTIRAVENHFWQHHIDLKLIIVADMFGVTSGLNVGCVMSTRFESDPPRMDRLRARLFISPNADRMQVRFWIACELFRLLFLLEIFISEGRHAWPHSPTTRAFEDEAAVFARELVRQLTDDVPASEAPFAASGEDSVRFL